MNIYGTTNSDTLNGTLGDDLIDDGDDGDDSIYGNGGTIRFMEVLVTIWLTYIPKLEASMSTEV